MRAPTRFHLLAVLVGLTTGSAAHAEIYKFVDENGHVTYTSIPRPGVKPQLVIPDLPPATGTATKPAAKATSIPARKTATPSHFPRVDPGTQRKRDDMRRQLLEEELRGEQRNLTAARAELAGAGRKPGTDLSRLTEAVRMHEKNIEMLNKELSRIR
jgi:hypothetical protein